MKTLSRRHPLVLGTVAAVVALVIAAGAAVGVGALTDDDGTEAPPGPVDASLHITPEDQEANPLVAEDNTGDAVPATPFPKLGGGLVSLADHEGTPMVVNFFGSWCVPCKKETPDIQRVHEELGDDVTFVGIAVNDKEQNTQAFVDRYGVTYEVGRDPSGKLVEAFGVVNMPSTFFVSAEGEIVGTRPGALDADVLRQLIRDNLHP